MRLKVGDTLQCKIALPREGYGIFCWKGDEVIITLIDREYFERINVMNKFGREQFIHVSLIDSHFYTIQELRKQKLNEIEGRR